MEKLSQELQYQFSIPYKKMLDVVKKPSPFEPPKTYANSQLYAPITLYKLEKSSNDEAELLTRIRTQIKQQLEKSQSKQKDNPLSRKVFQEKLMARYQSLKNHKEALDAEYLGQI